MKYITILLIGFLFSCSICKKNKAIKISGSFIGKESQETIVFDNESFMLLSPSDFIDTLSYGKWIAEDNMLLLYSDKKISPDDFNMEVEESFSGSIDSIYICVENRPEGLYNYDNTFTPYTYFNVERNFVNDEFDRSSQFVKNISLPNSHLLSVFNLILSPNLIIYPEKVSGRAFRTSFYKVKSYKNNTFKIKITEFNSIFFAYRRFNGDYIKIINSDTLLWDNEIYIKQKI